jgi:hypothetical protein
MESYKHMELVFCFEYYVVCFTGHESCCVVRISECPVYRMFLNLVVLYVEY